VRRGVNRCVRVKLQQSDGRADKGCGGVSIFMWVQQQSLQLSDRSAPCCVAVRDPQKSELSKKMEEAADEIIKGFQQQMSQASDHRLLGFL